MLGGDSLHGMHDHKFNVDLYFTSPERIMYRQATGGSTSISGIPVLGEREGVRAVTAVEPR
jgi:hypothetical protein